jgi:acyl carrier protein
MTTLEAMNQVFRRVFDDQTLSISPETTANEVEGWDSLSHINLILAVESRFKVKFSARELIGLKNVGELVAAVEAKLDA